MRKLWFFAVLAVLPAAHLSAQEPWPVIREIRYVGNETTRVETMQRELVIAVGDAADPARIERSRQGIQDLGLFRSVQAATEPIDDGVRVTFTVDEKFYLLPYPRVSANTDGQNTYGMELRWNNLFGLNHGLRLVYSSTDNREANQGRVSSYFGSYQAPFAFGSPYAITLSGGHATTPIEDPLTLAAYDEVIDQVQALVSRKFHNGHGPASQGWTAGAGLLWRNQDTAGPGAPEPYGHATAGVTQLGYRDQRFNIFSEAGTVFSARYEFAGQDYGSDYSYSRLTAKYHYSLPIGDTPHQTLEFGARLGSTNGGPPHQVDFGLGGAEGLRGFDLNFVTGNFFYVAGVEYLRPIFTQGLRLAVILEAGNAYDEADSINGNVYTSVGLGLRARFTRLVNFEFEAGVAMPLQGGPARFYGDRLGNGS